MTDHAEYLRYLAYRGVIERFGFEPIPQDRWLEVKHTMPADDPAFVIQQRLEHELHVIEEAGFPSYFLIIADLMRFCRDNDIPTGPGRGSVCGSLVAYLTYITDVDPLRFDIPFERFLHLERIAMPDIDLDICQDRRKEVIQYLYDQYGAENVAQIMTFGTMAAKGVVRDVCRVLHVDEHKYGDKSNKTGERLAEMIPAGSGADQVKIDEFLNDDQGQEFRKEIENLSVPFEGREISVLDTVRRLEGLRRHGSVHAAGVVIADRPLIEVVPLYKKNKQADIQIQFDYQDAEEIGLLKLDVLGLRTVTVLGDAEKLVRQKEPGFRIKEVPLDDDATFQLLCRGDTVGVFQLEGDGITAAVTGVKPDRFDDIIAILALYRPGPMEQLGTYIARKHGREPVVFPHPDLEPILARTYGLIVYQEQVMGLARVLAGYTPGEADAFRKAIGKKLPELIKEQIAKYTERAVARGYDPGLVDEIGKQIAHFGRYGFNLGHATGYAFITYWTAYLKANWPYEFYTAVFNSYVDDSSRLGTFLHDASRHNIRVLNPDINESGRGFTLTPQGIRFGIGAVKGVGDAMVVDILEERDHIEKNKYRTRREERVKADDTRYMASVRKKDRVPNTPRRYDDLYDFCARLPHIPVNVKKALVYAGAFGVDLDVRRSLAIRTERINEAAKAGRPEPDIDVPVEPESDVQLLRNEREMLGHYVSGHPLSYNREELERYGAYIRGEFEKMPQTFLVAGVVMSIRTHQARNGRMAWVTLETEITGMPEVTIFADLWSEVEQQFTKGAIVIVEGTRDRHPKFGLGFKATAAWLVDPARPNVRKLHITMPDTDLGDLATLVALCHTTDREKDAKLAKVQIAVQDGDRWALVATELRLFVSGAAIRQMPSRWGLRYNPKRLDVLPAGDSSLEIAKHHHQGSERVAVWELEMARNAVSLCGGKVIAELTPVSRARFAGL